MYKRCIECGWVSSTHDWQSPNPSLSLHDPSHPLLMTHGIRASKSMGDFDGDDGRMSISVVALMTAGSRGAIVSKESSAFVEDSLMKVYFRRFESAIVPAVAVEWFVEPLISRRNLYT